jgi:hypothetical protein
MPRKGKLAIHGGSRSVPDVLNLKPWPDITADDKAAVLAVMERGMVHGAHSREALGLEAEWKEFVGSKYVLAFN